MFSGAAQYYIQPGPAEVRGQRAEDAPHSRIRYGILNPEVI
jgi:hypothetical protein